MRRRGTTWSAGRRGLTLLELLLSLALLMLVITAIGFFVGPWLTGAGFDSQAGQFAAAMRFARAEAALTGRTLRLTFEEDPTRLADAGVAGDAGVAYRVRVVQELRPLEEPHVFTAVGDLPWIEQLEDLDQVVVTAVRLTGPDAAALRALGSAVDESADESGADAAAGITFYPDGTCDSAEIVLAPASRGDERRAVVQLAGLTGTVRHTIVTAASLEEEAAHPADDDGAARERGPTPTD